MSLEGGFQDLQIEFIASILLSRFNELLPINPSTIIFRSRGGKVRTIISRNSIRRIFLTPKNQPRIEIDSSLEFRSIILSLVALSLNTIDISKPLIEYLKSIPIVELYEPGFITDELQQLQRNFFRRIIEFITTLRLRANLQITFKTNDFKVLSLTTTIR